MYAAKARGQEVPILDSHPCLGDWSLQTPFDPHYFYQGAWLARKLSNARPVRHVDIGSSVLTVSVLSATVSTVFVDYRPLKVALAGLDSVAGDILQLPFANDSIASLSCLHVMEHIGLGRYGDPIDPEGTAKAAVELERVVRPGGRLYISVPIGWERVCFNAHRVHAPESLPTMFSRLKLVEFSYVDDSGRLKEDQSLSAADNLDYGCGLYVFEKRFT
jgi:SAM-dependent methyltransferase